MSNNGVVRPLELDVGSFFNMNPSGHNRSSLQRGSSLIARASSEQSVRDGCLELGRDAGLGNLYRTRYHISRNEEREGLCGEIMLEEMVPCCGDSTRPTAQAAPQAMPGPS